MKSLLIVVAVDEVRDVKTKLLKIREFSGVLPVLVFERTARSIRYPGLPGRLTLGITP